MEVVPCQQPIQDDSNDLPNEQEEIQIDIPLHQPNETPLPMKNEDEEGFTYLFSFRR